MPKDYVIVGDDGTDLRWQTSGDVCFLHFINKFQVRNYPLLLFILLSIVFCLVDLVSALN